MKLIVGLGNPGKQYEFTRHNAGFLMLDYYAMENNLSIDKLKFKSLICEKNIAGEKVIFAKPQTFMNLSGESIREIADFYKIPTNDILIIYDDISIELGRLRIRKKGSAGGHNGIKNTIYQLKTEEFPRVKIGVSENGNRNLVDYVLSPFSKKELLVLKDIAKEVVNIIDGFIKDDVDSLMNKFNSISLNGKED